MSSFLAFGFWVCSFLLVFGTLVWLGKEGALKLASGYSCGASCAHRQCWKSNTVNGYDCISSWGVMLELQEVDHVH